MKTPLTESNLRTLISTIDRADRETRGCAELSQSLRDQLIAALTSCLIDPDRLGLYLEILEEVLHREARYLEVLDDDSLEAVLQRGLEALTNDDLVRLALNPLALINLHDCIYDIDECVETPSDYWIDALYREAFGEAVSRD